MHIRSMRYEECLELFHKLREAGYPAQLYYSSEKWKVMVEGIIDNNKNLDLSRIV